ncbi:MAG: hypothetical protein ACLPNY_00045, partial [Roseiarcus sp.]
ATAIPLTVNANILVNSLSSLESGGTTVFASSTGLETSQESRAWANGAFTKALVEGIAQGKADAAEQGEITTENLAAYVANRVQALTSGKQHPVMGRPSQQPDFAIALKSGH